ncbi:unnamed protein product [Withania somnifera]
MAPLTPPPPTPAISSTTAASVTLLGSMNSLWAFWKKKPNTKTKNLSGSTSSLPKPKKFLAMFRLIRKKAKNEEEKRVEDDEDEGLWRKEILMGDKCQPLDFSGVIYYDRNGNRLSELPVKSPRATSPLPSYLYASSKYSEMK